jgi:hypothetical protein
VLPLSTNLFSHWSIPVIWSGIRDQEPVPQEELPGWLRPPPRHRVLLLLAGLLALSAHQGPATGHVLQEGTKPKNTVLDLVPFIDTVID